MTETREATKEPRASCDPLHRVNIEATGTNRPWESSGSRTDPALDPGERPQPHLLPLAPVRTLPPGRGIRRPGAAAPPQPDTFDLVRVSIDSHPDLAERFGIERVPTLCVVDERKLRRRIVAPRGCRGSSTTSSRGSADARLADLDELCGRVLDLERRVLEAEAVTQQRLELAADAVAVASRLDEHVRRERRELGGHLPDVEVVHLNHAGIRGHRRPDLLHRQPGRSDVEQDAARVGSSRHAACSISAATNSAATASARTQPVRMITAPAIAVAMKA